MLELTEYGLRERTTVHEKSSITGMDDFKTEAWVDIKEYTYKLANGKTRCLFVWVLGLQDVFNTVTNAFLSTFTKKYYRGLSDDRACELGVMTEGDIPKKYRHFIYCLDILKTYQRENKLFEFSGYTNKGEKIDDRINDVTLQGLRCNQFRFSRSLMFAKKATILLDNRLYQKISAICQRLPMKMHHDLWELFTTGTGRS